MDREVGTNSRSQNRVLNNDWRMYGWTTDVWKLIDTVLLTCYLLAYTLLMVPLALCDYIMTFVYFSRARPEPRKISGSVCLPDLLTLPSGEYADLVQTWPRATNGVGPMSAMEYAPTAKPSSDGLVVLVELNTAE